MNPTRKKLSEEDRYYTIVLMDTSNREIDHKVLPKPMTRRQAYEILIETLVRPDIVDDGNIGGGYVRRDYSNAPRKGYRQHG